MSFPAMSGGQGTIPPVCQNCSTSTTPLWRRDESGAVLCNACGLFLKLHGTSRPISLKTNVIKSRNRVKTAGQQGTKRKSLLEGSLPASQSQPQQNAPQIQQIPQRANGNGSEHSGSPFSRTDTPSHQHPSNIAPQHMFDGISFTDRPFNSPAIPHMPFRNPSPGSNSSNNDRLLETPHTWDGLLQANSALKTRVNELEVINGLYQGHYQQGQPPAPQAEMVEQDSMATLRRQLEESQHMFEEMKRRCEDLERENAELRGEEPRAKRTRQTNEPEYPEPPTSLSANGMPS